MEKVMQRSPSAQLSSKFENVKRIIKLIVRILMPRDYHR